MTDYVIMPESDYESACRAIRAKTGKTSLIKSGDMAEEIAGIPVTGEASFNIHYGMTAPEDTSKLWVETDINTSSVAIGTNIVPNCSINTFVGSLPNATSGIASAVVGTNIYLFGGGGMSYSEENQDTIQIYNTDSDSITTVSTKLPQKATQIAAVAVDKKVYLFGGVSYSALNTINVFDTETNTIETLDVTLPLAAWSMQAVLVDRNIYLIGGCYSNGTDYRSRIDIFNVDTHSITTISTTYSIYDTAVEVIGTNIYIFGGRSNYRSIGTNTIKCLDTKTNTLTTLSTQLPQAEYGLCSARLGTKVYLFGGMSYSTSYSSYYRYYDNIFEYDAETDTIVTLSSKLPVTSAAISAAVIGTKVYLFGGQNLDGQLSSVNTLTVATPLNKDSVYLAPSLTNNIFTLVDNRNSIRLGVDQVFIGNADGIAERVNAYLHNGTTWELI